MKRVVLDTNVLVSAMRSRRGPAYRLLSLVGEDLFEIVLSVPLVFEYEDVLRRSTDLGDKDVTDLVNYLCSVCIRQQIFYLWRPLLRDPKDDMVLELAIASRSRSIVTFNLRDFAQAADFGVEVVTPANFLQELGVPRWEP